MHCSFNFPSIRQHLGCQIPRDFFHMAATASFSVIIIGGGLVGSLAAVFFAKRGWNVDVYEMRAGTDVLSPQTLRCLPLSR